MIRAIGRVISFIAMASVSTPGNAWIVNENSKRIENSIKYYSE